MSDAPLVILGCGYIGTRVARAALAAGRTVRVASRSTGKLAPLGALGAELKYVDAALPKQLPAVMAGMRGGTLLYSVPPIGSLPSGDGPRKALQAAAGAGMAVCVYLSSSGLYGPDPDDEAEIDDSTEITRDDPAMAGVRGDEDAIAASSFAIRTVVLRKGDYRLLDDGQHAISRIHVDDVVQAVLAAEDRAAHGSTYLLADDEPTTQRAYATWLCERMGLPVPPTRALLEPGRPRGSHRNRRLRADRVKRDLGLTWRYPTFRDGEAAIEAEEAADAS